MRKAAPLMNTLAHSVAVSAMTSIDQRRAVPIAAVAMPTWWHSVSHATELSLTIWNTCPGWLGRRSPSRRPLGCADAPRSNRQPRRCRLRQHRRPSRRSRRPSPRRSPNTRSAAPTFTGRSWPLADVRLLAPILASKVVCMGKNYAAHAEEMGGGDFRGSRSSSSSPTPRSSVRSVPIQLPADANPVHHEGELAVVIGRPCKDVPAARAAENILGYTIANDVSARDQQKQDGQWTRAKGHDTFCPLGPVDRHRPRSRRPRPAHRGQRASCASTAGRR